MPNSSVSDNESIAHHLNLNIPSGSYNNNMPFCGQVVLVPHIAMGHQMLPITHRDHHTTLFRSSTYHQVTNVRSTNGEENNHSRMLAMESTIKQLKSLLQNELKARESESEKVGLLEAEISIQKEENEELKQTLEVVEGKVDSLEQEKVTLEQNLKTAKEELAVLTEELEQVKDERLDLEKSLAELRDRLSANQETKVAQQQEDVMTRLNDVVAENTSLRAVNKKISEEFHKLDHQLREIKKELSNRDATMELLRNEHYSLQEKAMKSSLLIESQRTLIDGLKSQINELALEKKNHENYLMVRDTKIREACGTMALELESLKSSKEKKDILFNELAIKHVYMIEYAGEKLYDQILEKHNDFLNQLTVVVQRHGRLDGENEEAYQKTVDCVRSQIATIQSLQSDFKERVEKAMRLIENGKALVSDLNFRAPIPKLETSAERFDALLSYFSSLE